MNQILAAAILKTLRTKGGIRPEEAGPVLDIIKSGDEDRANRWLLIEYDPGFAKFVAAQGLDFLGRAQDAQPAGFDPAPQGMHRVFAEPRTKAQDHGACLSRARRSLSRPTAAKTSRSAPAEVGPE